MTYEEYLNGGMPLLPDSVASLYKEVRDQAASHTSRKAKARILDKVRPSRPDSLKKYVQDNVRYLTVGEYRKFLLKTSRLLKSNDLQITTGQPVQDWLDSNPFWVDNVPADLWTWIYSTLLPTALSDPNGVLVPLPYWNGDIPPYTSPIDGGIPENEVPKIGPLIVGSEKIRYKGDGILVFEWKKYPVGNGEQMGYMVVDDSGFTLLVPYLVDRKIVYRAEPWFDTTKYIAANLPGHYAGKYKESYLQSMFEYFDEFDSTFADNQAVRVQHAYPKTIIDGIPCPEPGCMGGKKKTETGIVDCGECDKGFIKSPDVYSVLRRPMKVPGETTASNPPIEFVFPPIESLKITYDVAFDMLQRGKRSVGIDLLVDGTESGVSKRYRLEDYDDMMQALAQGLMSCVQTFLKGVAELIGDGGPIEYTVPLSFNLQTVMEMQDEFSGSHHSIRRSIYINMVTARTHGNEDEIRKHELALEAAPLLTMTEEEIRVRLATGVYGEFDVWLADNAVKYAEGSNTPEELIQKARADYESNRTAGAAAPVL